MPIASTSACPNLFGSLASNSPENERLPDDAQSIWTNRPNSSVDSKEHLAQSSPQNSSPNGDELGRAWSTEQRQAVVGKLLDQHFDRVYRYANYLSGCPTVAEDIAQEVFLRAFRSIHQLKDEATSVGWLLTITRNEFRRYCQIQKKCVDINDYSIATVGSSIDELHSQDWVQFAISKLPVEFRLVVLMFYFEEKSYAEIANDLELPMGTVMSRLNRARGHLKQALEAQVEAPHFSRPAKNALVKDNQ
jgi:RNA polymerase sigma-70 factor, ECF subfamily